jgi:hypothetical protein
MKLRSRFRFVEKKLDDKNGMCYVNRMSMTHNELVAWCDDELRRLGDVLSLPLGSIRLDPERQPMLVTEHDRRWWECACRQVGDLRTQLLAHATAGEA